MIGSYSVGPSLAQLKDDIDVASLFDAISTGLSKGQPKMTEADATATIQAFMGSKQAEMQAKAAAAAQTNREEGNAFLAKNKTQPGVVTPRRACSTSHPPGQRRASAAEQQGA
jgi:FKBP-type peptidyl-prolyl cis-trans isomerase FkpA